MNSLTHGPSRLAPLLVCLLLGSLLMLTGCASFEGMFSNVTFGKQKEVQGSPETLLTEGMDAFSAGKYKRSATLFEKILDEYPFSKEAMLAELKAADAHYYDKSYLEAKLLYQEFEERHPTNEAIPYVIFQIGMCDFTRSDRIDRDTTGARDAIRSFSRLLRTFPDSPYTKEAKARIEAAHDFLVNHEYLVAVFYVRTKKYDQAQHRLRYLLATYPESTIAPTAKALLAKLEAGDPPEWGVEKWLPDFKMPSWMLWTDEDKDETDTGKS